MRDSLSVLAALLAAAGVLSAQDPPRLDGHAVAVLHHVDPVPGGDDLAELRVVHPVLMLHAAPAGLFSVRVTADLEVLTVANGELAPGAWGEGFMDRRHPHTTLHEAMVTAPLAPVRLGPLRAAVSLGKGFVPFGTDDPMSRPPVRYPVNHHLAQILERAVGILLVQAGPAALEAALFNGDEPERPWQLPRVARFGDSWAVRLTVAPWPGVEAQASRAHVTSPEHRDGSGPDGEKWSASARWERDVGGVATYALVEWARTTEADGFFAFHSALAEFAASTGPHGGYLRFERTERPEEERRSAWRSVRPHVDDTILGVTRWTTWTLGYGIAAPVAAGVVLRPFVEATWADADRLEGVFDPAGYYGRSTFRSLSLGVRVRRGLEGHRMGRYRPVDEIHHGH